ncbi:EAL domain-containing protein [Marinobacter sp. M216]|uniref:EAL domain-containing protein n=1 Tax=Marinobacter albus TaxID=3030833 RepID=A0ABT7H7J7_9GAMM|nr:EAL domain-containing protein [Marinobacter sp. M216]MDK9556328.1 EAL domain-containing protein [Marinobacter sp. M216]
MRHFVTFIDWPRLLATLLLLLAFASPSHGAEGYYVPHASYLTVPAGTDALPENLLESGNWQSLRGRSPNFGYIEDTLWLRFPVPDQQSLNLLEISYAHLDRVRFFLVEDGKIVRSVTTGDAFPFKQRPILHRHFLFPFERSGEGRYDILLEVQTSGAMQVPLTLWNDKSFFESSFIEDQVHAVYYGILITAIFLNLFVFLALRERVYLLYVLSTLGYLLLIGTLNGMTFQALWPTSPEIQNRAMLLSIPMALIFTLWFSRSFLNLDRASPALERTVILAIAINSAAALATFVLDYSTSIRLVVALSIPSSLLLTLLGPQQWLRGNRQAAYYTLAWGALTLGSAITAANKYGFLPNSFLTVYAMQIGSALQAVLLAMAMAVRMLQERQDKVEAREAELRAMTARRSAELKLMDHALHNPLTGLPNRSGFEMTLNDLMMRSPEKRFGIVVIHLNNLDSVTKTLGHRNSDQILELASKHYNAVLRDLPGAIAVEQTDKRSYFLASLDPQTFAFVVDADVAEAAARSVVNALEDIRYPVDYLGMQVPMDARLGVAIFPDHGMDANTLIRRAVIAEGTERALERGMAYYKPSRDSFSADRLTIVSELRQALIDNRLALYLQPKVSLATGAVVGLEALIRWPEKQSQIRPDEIVVLAEQTGLIKPLTRWVLEQALTMRSRLLEHGWPLDLSVNISPNNLREPDFPLHVQRLMSSFQQHRDSITFEVTETSMMQDPANSLTALKLLNDSGIPVSIDDFGSGYSSLSYIKQLPASEIKIDRSLISDLVTRAEDRVIVQTTIDMCHSLGYKVVAEGVEDETTAGLLRGMGCDMIQGFLLTPPLPFDDMLDWLSHSDSQQQKLG